MNCSNIHEMISAYVDRELDDANAVALFAHLTACDACRGKMIGLLALRESIHRSRPHEFPASLDRRIGGLHFGDKPPVEPITRRSAIRLIRQKISLPVSVLLLVVMTTILGSAYVTSKYFPLHEVIEKSEQELVYIMELPQVEVKGQAVDAKHIR